MVRFIADKVKPTRGFAHAFHLSFLAILPPALLVLVRLEFFTLALIVLLLSKWRMLALHPRHWLPHLRTNAVDLVVGLSVLVFMMDSSTLWVQITWALLFEVWLLFVKPGTSAQSVALQAAVAQGVGTASVFLAFETANLVVLTGAFWSVSYFSARHFFNAFEETEARLLSSVWAFFAGSIMWVLGHWLLFIGPVAQPALIVSGLAYGLGGMYYLKKRDKLTVFWRRQIILTMFVLLFVVIVFSDWGDKTL